MQQARLSFKSRAGRADMFLRQYRAKIRLDCQRMGLAGLGRADSGGEVKAISDCLHIVAPVCIGSPAGSHSLAPDLPALSTGIAPSCLVDRLALLIASKRSSKTGSSRAWKAERTSTIADWLDERLG
jgi:hypothetical protein